MIACLCGRPCKGRRGLRAHQRACRQLRDLNVDPHTDPDVYTAPPAHIINDVKVNSGDSGEDPPSPPTLPTVHVLPNIKLPKTKQQWEKGPTYTSRLTFQAYRAKETYPFGRVLCSI